MTQRNFRRFADISRLIKPDGRILRCARSEHYDRCWQTGRAFYYITDQFGQRYSEDYALPEWAWLTMDDEPQETYFSGGQDDATRSF